MIDRNNLSKDPTHIKQSVHRGAQNPMSKNSFRYLNSNELHVLGKLAGIANLLDDQGECPDSIDWDQLTVSYETFPGGFTVCLLAYLVDNGHTFVWRGASRRSKHDKPNHIKGEILAFKRAVLHSRPV